MPDDNLPAGAKSRFQANPDEPWGRSHFGPYPSHGSALIHCRELCATPSRPSASHQLGPTADRDEPLPRVASQRQCPEVISARALFGLFILITARVHPADLSRCQCGRKDCSHPHLASTAVASAPPLTARDGARLADLRPAASSRCPTCNHRAQVAEKAKQNSPMRPVPSQAAFYATAALPMCSGLRSCVVACGDGFLSPLCYPVARHALGHRVIPPTDEGDMRCDAWRNSRNHLTQAIGMQTPVGGGADQGFPE